MKKIQLSQNKFCLVDDEDFDMLNKHKWYFCNGYAMRNKASHCGLIRMHRVINNTPDGFFTDHINRNKLDNRKCNLRTVTKSQNEHNTPERKNNKYGIKGVYLDKRRNKWKAEIMINNKKLFLGYYIFPEMASNAYNMAKKTYAL